MITLTGQYYDGLRPIPIPARMDFSGRKSILTAGQISERYDVGNLSVSPRIGRTDRFITLPNGAQFKCEDNLFFHSLPQDSSSEGLVAWMEERWGIALASVVIIVCLLLVGYFYGLPVAAEHIAARIPIETEQALGQKAVHWLDNQGWFKPTTLAPDKQKDILDGFDKLHSDLPLNRYYKLEFRNAQIFGPNAFAFPGGIIVITDGMAKLAKSPEEALAVLAHEIGHVELRHALRSVLQNSAVAALAATVTSDAASLSIAVASLPVLLAQTKYSREFETAADEYAFNLLKQKGYSPVAFASIMDRLSKDHTETERQFAYISSHPITAQRIERARAASLSISTIDQPNKPIEWSNIIMPSQEYELSNIALKKMLDHGQPNSSEIKYMLTAHDFKTLEKKYEEMFQRYQIDEQYENYLRTAYNIFTPYNEDVSLKDLDLWVAQTGSYIAYAARGSYKTTQGFFARGGKHIDETPASKIDEMKRIHIDAVNDLQIAIRNNPALMPSYENLIQIAKASNMPFTPKQILDQATRNDSRTFFVRYQYIVSLQPRWGGSHDEMNAFAQQATEYVKLNPRLWSLMGEASADLADNYQRESDYAAAIESYKAALKSGDRVSWLENRAACYYRLGQKDKSATDYKKILHYMPQHSMALKFSDPDGPSGFKYELKDNSYINPDISKYKAKSYAVLSAEHRVEWLRKRGDKAKEAERNTIAKIEHMLKQLGYECAEREKIDKILSEQGLRSKELINIHATRIGKLINVDVVVYATVPSMGVNHQLRSFFKNIDIKAISTASGIELWNSHLGGSVSAENYRDYVDLIVLDSIEAKLLEHVQKKLNDKMPEHSLTIEKN